MRTIRRVFDPSTSSVGLGTLPVQAAPLVTVAWDAATDRMAARMGPMQGAQPNAKASPIT